MECTSTAHPAATCPATAFAANTFAAACPAAVHKVGANFSTAAVLSSAADQSGLRFRLSFCDQSSDQVRSSCIFYLKMINLL